MTKKPQEKSPEYMRKAYLYTGILLILALIGGAILSNLIIGAEARSASEAEQSEEIQQPDEIRQESE